MADNGQKNSLKAKQVNIKLTLADFILSKNRY